MPHTRRHDALVRNVRLCDIPCYQNDRGEYVTSLEPGARLVKLPGASFLRAYPAWRSPVAA